MRLIVLLILIILATGQAHAQQTPTFGSGVPSTPLPAPSPPATSTPPVRAIPTPPANSRTPTARERAVAMSPPEPPLSARPAAAMTNLPPPLSARVTAMYLDAQRMIAEQSSATWQRLFLSGLTQLDQDWSKYFAGYCGNRPACGLQPEQKPK